jgi:predicted choloylglycine hydrolase
MPELVPLWEELTRLAGGGEEVARLLSLYRPTPYLSGCSQAVWTRGAPLLVRNYDYHPAACEGSFLATAWTGTRVLAASDCLWGVLDGVNEHGLTVALAFGGRRVVGDGFGIPLVLRYVLELCRTTDEGAAVLARVPCNMAYNVSLVDASGAHAVVHVAPDRQPLRMDTSVATNHQRRVEWPEHDRVTRSAERERFLAERLQDPALDAAGFTALFLEPPLFSRNYARAFGTLYTAAYRPLERSLLCLWPGASVRQSLDDFRETELDVAFGA